MSIIDSQEPAYREEHEIDVLTRRIERLESLVRDMHALSKAPTPYTPAEVVAYMDMAESIDQRMAALGLLEGADGCTSSNA